MLRQPLSATTDITRVNAANLRILLLSKIVAPEITVVVAAETGSVKLSGTRTVSETEKR